MKIKTFIYPSNIAAALCLFSLPCQAEVTSTGSLNQDWRNPANWGGIDPLTNPTEVFVIQNGHTLGPLDNGAAATEWPATGLRIESGGVLSLDHGNAIFSPSTDGLEINGGTVRVSAAALNTESEMIGDVKIVADSTLEMNANSLTFSGGTISGSGNLNGVRSVNTPDSGNGFPALILRSKMYTFSGNIDTASWTGWGRFVVQNGNWGTGDLTLNPAGGGVLRPGATFNTHGRLFVPNSSAKVDLKKRTNIFAPGTSFAGQEIEGTYNWVNDNTLAFTDVPTTSGTTDLSAFLLNTTKAVICIYDPVEDTDYDVNNLFDLDEPISLENLSAFMAHAKDVSAYRESTDDSSRVVDGLEEWRWGPPFVKISSIAQVHELTRDVSLLDAAMALAEDIMPYADAHPATMPLEQEPLEINKFVAPIIAARMIYEHALIYPDEVSADKLSKAKVYLDWSIGLLNRFAVQDTVKSTRPAQIDSWNGMYAEGNRTLNRPWNRQLWWSRPCSIAREAITAYTALHPSDTSYLDDAENYMRIILATAKVFEWNADMRAYGDTNYTFWSYGTERHWDAPKNATASWRDAMHEGRVIHHLAEDTQHSGPDLYSFYSFAKLANKRPEYAPFQDLSKRTIHSMIDHSAKRANTPTSSVDPRKGPLYWIHAPWRTLSSKTTYLPSSYAMNGADYMPEIYRIALSSQARSGKLDRGSINFMISGKLEYLKATTGTPEAPTFAVKQSSGGQRIDWPPSPEVDVTGYHVYRAPTTSGPYTRIATGIAETEFTDVSGNGDYVVTAVDSLGNESAPSASATVFALPSAPSNLSLHNRNDGVELTWTASAAADVATYNVYRSHGGTTPFYPITTGIKGEKWVDTKPYVDTPSNPPHYKVTAVNLNYTESGFSNEAVLSQGTFVVYDDRMISRLGAVTMDVTANDVLVQWENAVDIHTVGDSLISQNGTQVESSNMNGSAVTVNGVTFEDKDPFISTLYGSTTDANIYKSGNVGSAFESMLDSIRWLDKQPAHMLMDHMESGKSYELQLLVSDERSNSQKDALRQFSLCGVKSPSYSQNSFSMICRFAANRRLLNLYLSHKGDDATVSLCGYQIREIPSIQNLVLNTVTQPANGQVTMTGNQVTYVPAPGFTGADSFTYEVTETNTGQSGTGTVSVVVYNPVATNFGNLPPKAVLLATPRVGPAPLSVQLDASRSSDDGSIVSYEWDLDGDGQVDADGPTASSLYPTDGVYEVSLRITDDQGVEVVKTISVLVGNPLLPRVWYKFDETSGSVAHDSSGNGFDGTVNRTAGWIPGGKDGGALDFNQATSVSIPDAVFSTISDKMTMSFWVHDQGRTFSDCRLLSASCPQGSWRANFPWGSNEVKFEFAHEYVYYNTSNFDEIGKDWTHWVVIKDQPDSRVQIYRNGALVTNWTGRNAKLDSTTNFVLGVASGNYFPGAIDDFRIYDRVLPATEITEVYQQTAALDGYGLWKKAYELVDGKLDDTDLDGLENRVEYALNLDPLIKDKPLGYPYLDISGGTYVDVSYPASVAAATVGDVIVILQGSDSLRSNWQDISQVPWNTDLIESGTTRVITQRLSLINEPRYFFRLKIDEP